MRKTHIPDIRTKDDGKRLMARLIVSEKRKNLAGRRLIRQIDRARIFEAR